MNKKINKVNFGILPVIIILAISGVFYLTFTGKIGFNKQPEFRRLNGFPTVNNSEKQVDKVRKVIKTQEELTEFLNYIDDSGYLTLRENVNFDKEWLIAVSTDTQAETGHKLKVRKMYEDKEKNLLLVSIQEDEAGKSCEIMPQKNTALDIVAISHTELNIDFERIKKIVECD